MGACGTADIECFLLACAGRQCDASYLYHAYALVYGALWLFLLLFYSEVVICSYVCHKEAAFQAGRADHSHVFWSTPIPHTTLPFLRYWYYSTKGIWFLGDVAVNTVIVLLALYFCKGHFKHDWKYFALFALLTIVPYVSYRSPHMYFFFAAGYCLPAYVKSDFRYFIKYWKWGLVLFVASYIAFSNMPWSPEDFWYDYHHQSILQLVVNDSLKIILGVIGSYLALIFLYKLLPYMKETSLYHLVAKEGQYTLDIYLIQIIVIEKLLGPFYKQLVSQSGINWVRNCDGNQSFVS